MSNGEPPKYTPARRLTKEQHEDVQRLRALWDVKQTELGLTQAEVARLCGWRQTSAFGHYLHGRTPLNVEAACKLARVLRVNPEEIMPSITKILGRSAAGVDPNTLDIAYKIQRLEAIDRQLIEALCDRLQGKSS